MGNNLPYFYNYKNVCNSLISPSTMHVHNSALARFFQRWLLQKAMSVYKWEFPDEWAENYVLYCIYELGYVSVFNTDKFGVIPQGCGLSGYNVMYQPRVAVITNPLFDRPYELPIGEMCELIVLKPDYGGILDLVQYYGDLMALASESLAMNLANSKLSYLFGVDSKTAAESLKKLFDKVQGGEPAVVFDNKLRDNEGNLKIDLLQQSVGSNFISPELLAVLKQIEAQFDTAVGIPNFATSKKERAVTDEVNSNNVDAFTRADETLKRLKKCCEKVNRMFNLNITVDWRVNPMENTLNDNGINNTGKEKENENGNN